MPNDWLPFSRRVPDDGVNLARTEIPPIARTENIPAVETGMLVAENTIPVRREGLNPSVVGQSSGLAHDRENLSLS